MKITGFLYVLLSLAFLLPEGSGDYASLILGEWRRHDPDGTFLLYEKYVFHKDGRAIYSEQYLDGHELNEETRTYRIAGNILIIELKKIIGRGKEYYRYKIISLSESAMILQLMSKYLRTEPETWARP